ncbi:MAG: DbpA RNA binding domain-containing protein, partial [Treponema sp.]|jgi:ATP-dependent RNA helicase DeaD|nr:DbpA RNA binding domain-containing protein [Treponema sp.]
MERVLGSGILWMKVPSVKSVMKAVRARIVTSVLGALPGEQPLVADTAETAEVLALSVPAGGTPDEETSVGKIPVGETLVGETLVREIPEGAAPAREVSAMPFPALPAALPEKDGDEEPSSPFLAKVCRQLIERVGAEKAVEALISMGYGELLDPSRYGTVTEFAEESFRDEGRRGALRGHLASGRRLSGNSRAEYSPRAERRPGRPFRSAQGKAGREGDFAGGGRVYVGLGRRHGASARDVASLLSRAGDVPGRLVDAIEMRDYCAFATLPEEAARRACAFSRKTPDSPPIRLASAPRD